MHTLSQEYLTSDDSQSISEADGSQMYQAGDTVMHPAEGVCTILGIQTRVFGASPRKYYVLQPCDEKNSDTVYIPVDRGDRLLRRLLSRQDILGIIHESARTPSVWTPDSKRRKEAFTQILSSSDYARMLRMICDIRLHTTDEKKMNQADKAALETAERMIAREFSIVLHLSIQETIYFAENTLKQYQSSDMEHDGNEICCE